MYLLVLSSDAVNSHRTYSDSSTSPLSHSSASLTHSSRLQQRSPTALAMHSPTARIAYLQHLRTLIYSTRTRQQHSSLTYSSCFGTRLHTQHSPTALPYNTCQQLSSPTALAYSAPTSTHA